MEERPVLPAPEQVQSLGCISARLRAGETLGRPELERALEQGFGCLIGLKAERQRRLDPMAGEVKVHDASGDELERWIGRLSDALTELRRLSSPEAPTRIGYGFVLPRRDRPPVKPDGRASTTPRLAF
jgi:hypothetical protein